MDTYVECRTCLENISDSNIFNVQAKITEEKNVLQAIEEIASIQTSDNDLLPKSICKSCFTSLKSSITFRRLVISSYEALKKRLDPDPTFISCGLTHKSNFEARSFTLLEPPPLVFLPQAAEQNHDVKIETRHENRTRNNTEADTLSEDKDDIHLKVEIKLDDDSGLDRNDNTKATHFKTTKARKSKKSRHVENIDSSKMVRRRRRVLKKSVEPKLDDEKPVKKVKIKKMTPRLCPICGKLFKARQNFNSHMTTVHRKKPVTPEKISCLCPDCGRIITGTRQNFVAHRRYHHSGKVQVKRKFQCDSCPKKFSTEEKLDIHKRKHKGEKAYVCDICNKSYTQYGSLLFHKRKQHLKKPYGTCNYCGKQLYDKQNLETHIRQWHTGERPYACEICGKSFSNNGTLLRHRKDSHGEKKPCPKCGKMYTEGELRKHLYRHRIQEEGIKRKKYTCEYCGTEMNYTSRRRHLLKQHGIVLRGRGDDAERIPVNRADSV